MFFFCLCINFFLSGSVGTGIGLVLGSGCLGSYLAFVLFIFLFDEKMCGQNLEEASQGGKRSNTFYMGETKLKA